MKIIDEKCNDIAAVGIGANLGRPEKQLHEALNEISLFPDVKFIAASGLYLTEPQGGPAGQPWFHNQVAVFEVKGTPADFLKKLLALELKMGRTREIFCGPRTIDLDIIFFGQEVIDQPPHLIVPHPRLHLRHFVLAPLAELAPNWRHPVLGRTVSQLLDELSTEGQAVIGHDD